MQLARQLTSRLPWLRTTTRPGRIAPMLARFERAAMPWTADDVIAAVDAVNKRMGWTALTSQYIRTNGHAVLASYLRNLDVNADHPRLWKVLADAQRHAEQNQRRLERERALAERATPPTDRIAGIRATLRTRQLLGRARTRAWRPQSRHIGT